VVLSTISQGLVFVQPETRGVVISALQQKGIRTQALQPGLRFVMPFFESVLPYPIAKQTYTMSGASGEGQIAGDDSVIARTADGQEVRIDGSVIFSISPSDVVTVHIEWQNRYVDGLIRPKVRGIIRDAAAQYGVQDIYSLKRADLSAEVEQTLSDTMADNGLILDAFVLRNITFTPEYASVIEQKQIAEQEVERQAFIILQREQEADQLRMEAKGKADANVLAAEGEAQAILIEAEAQAQALREIGDALTTSPDLLQYQYVQNLSDDVRVMLVPSNSPYLFDLPEIDGAASETE
jgi:regulator of protease activity HflC (stomatin/prohibitin superfamily)